MNYDNTNRGMLARNDKQGNESRPDYRGSINVAGVEYWLSAWIKEGREGTKLEGQRYMSLSVQPKDAQPAPAPAPAPAPVAAPAPTAPRRPSQAEQDARAIAERRAREAAPRPSSGTGFDSMEDDIPF
jgi:pyruvate/2-oxoglutarate dehydrogenase complex dihydrolipoamide acyltransferase (E2) component